MAGDFECCTCWPFNLRNRNRNFQRVGPDDEFAPMTRTRRASSADLGNAPDPELPGFETRRHTHSGRDPRLTVELGNIANGPADLYVDDMPSDSDARIPRDRQRRRPLEVTDIEMNSGDDSAYPLSEDPDRPGEFRRSRRAGRRNKDRREDRNRPLRIDKRPIPTLRPPPDHASRNNRRRGDMETTESELSDESPKMRKSHSMRDLRSADVKQNELFDVGNRGFDRAQTDGEVDRNRTRADRERREKEQRAIRRRINPKDDVPSWEDESRSTNNRNHLESSWRDNGNMMSDTDIPEGELSEVPNHPILGPAGNIPTF